LNGWLFSPTAGYTEGEPAYLSMAVGSGFSLDDLSIWHFDGSTWTSYDATDLNYDGTYANFTVNGFSGYAVTSVSRTGVTWPARDWGDCNDDASPEKKECDLSRRG
jgi:hypothetical protein